MKIKGEIENLKIFKSLKKGEEKREEKTIKQQHQQNKTKEKKRE